MPSSNITIAQGLRTWFRSCPSVSSGNRFHVDYLSAQPTEYTINVAPTQIDYKVDVLGEVYVNPIQTVNFVFACREDYSADVLQNLTNLGFFDELISWMIEQNKLHNFPIISDGDVISVMPTLTQYLYEATADTGRYQINCVLKYRRK